LSSQRATAGGRQTQLIRDLPRTAKAALAALALTGLLVLVAIAARGSHPSGHGRVSQRKVPDQVNNDLFTIIVVLYVAGVIALIVGFIMFRSKWEPVKSHWIRTQLIQVVFFSIIAVIGYHLFSSKGFKHAAQKAQKAQTNPGGKPSRVKPEKPKPSNTGGASFDWTLGIGLLGLLLVGGALYYVRVRSRPPLKPLPVAEDVKAELSAALSDAIDDLLNEPDARRAVIAAYARMEGVLARRGFPRHPAETPFEYLSRILLSLRVRESAVRELTDLFERAKFSPHEIDQAMKERAVSALVSVREDLQPAAAAA
jgi:Domain of unknown function (DUF4129)